MINVISTEVKKAGCYVFHSLYDADVDIELSFLEFSTTVIGEDADLLVLLLYHADINSKPLYFKSSKESNEMEIRNILKRLLHNIIKQFKGLRVTLNFYSCMLSQDVIPYPQFME